MKRLALISFLVLFTACGSAKGNSNKEESEIVHLTSTPQIEEPDYNTSIKCYSGEKLILDRKGKNITNIEYNSGSITFEDGDELFATNGVCVVKRGKL